ncbi:hypothetical protein J0X14_13185 [Muricauda sp. CAU 1633]|uniref:hypothetical protein n=1 Tax=Allomuricauda sp. CAU 1633 TaxID=2816036 RepID=UPI001A8F026B|nr:hypothetical protein [Muricauda sp. CAU 1633]MBO0323256.1 hypothetical protein [Muricauda sp. CAU 1633]
MEDHELPKYLQSIFYPLYQHTTDVKCKLMLLDQMLEVGDKKEIPFLEELESSGDPKISNKAFEVKSALQEKLGVISEREKRRLPMNLCFIYDEFNIRPNKVDSELDFEVTLDIMEMEK